MTAGPPYIHKGTRRRVKKGNTKPRPFWLNVYFIVIKMPACIIIVCVHWNIYLRMVERAGNNSNKTQELHTLLLLYIVPPVTLLEGTEQSNQNFYTCVNFQACYFLFWFEVIFSLLFPGKSSRTPWIQGQVTYYAAVLDFGTLFTLSINTLLCLSVFRTPSVESAQCVQIATPQLQRCGGETGRVSLFATRADYIISCMA